MGRKKKLLLPSAIVFWGEMGCRRKATRQHEGAWKEESRWRVTRQRPHMEARRTLSLSPVGTALLLALASCPWAPCPGLAVSCSLSQRLANTAMRSWGGASWRAHDLCWSCSRCMAETWTWRLSNLPPGLVSFQRSGSSNQPLRSHPPQSQTPTKVEHWLGPWTKA